ncbi:hypothetical protein ACS0TY_032895 [Phlomoides rotata]
MPHEFFHSFDEVFRLRLMLESEQKQGNNWVLRLQAGDKYCLLGRLSSEVGWNHYDTIRELEKKRKDLLSSTLLPPLSTECEFANPALDGSGPPAMLDAPVSGGILSAENGSLIFMFKEKTYSRDQIVNEMWVEWAECIQREI